MRGINKKWNHGYMLVSHLRRGWCDDVDCQAGVESIYAIVGGPPSRMRKWIEVLHGMHVWQHSIEVDSNVRMATTVTG